MTPRTVTTLRKARALVVQGWCQGTAAIFIGDTLCLCAVAACFDGALHDSLRWQRAVAALERAIGKKWGGHVARWNDAPGRTKAQVLGLFTRAIHAELKAGRR